MKEVVFVLPPDRNKQVGGYKIVYEYANRLVARGWQVSIGYDCRNVGAKVSVPLWIKKRLARSISLYRRVINPRWFDLSHKVHKFCIYDDDFSINVKNLVATAYGTSSIVYRSNSKNKLYLIQDFENWDGVTSEEIMDSYRLGMKNVVIAKWLKNIVDKSCGNEESIMIANGIDSREFYLEKNIKDRTNRFISMLYHEGEHKGSIYGIRALVILKKIYPDLQAVLFGVPKRPDDLPQWIKYVRKATSEQLRDIYNSSQIFLYPTIEEGFGLTCVESMACGCALCASDYKGVHEFAVNGINALLSPVKDVAAMVDNVCTLFENDELRIKIAEEGRKSVGKFDWEKSVDKFESLLKQ